jgi:outer membrane protein OmpA-like peptidoglycan-associated protein
MKNNLKLIPVLLISVIIISFPAYSKDRNTSLKAIEQSENSLKNLDSLIEIKQYIPSDIYNEAVINIINARSQYDKSEFDSAYYLATVAYIRLEAAKNFSKAKENKNKKIMLELESCRKNPTGINSNKINAILDSGLLKKNETLTISILDKNLFSGGDFKLSDAGKKKLSGIIEVIKLFPECSVKIAGHSSSFDYKAYTKYKAEAIMKYFISSGVTAENVSSDGIGNNEVLETPVGFKRLDRVEIIISGIKF